MKKIYGGIYTKGPAAATDAFLLDQSQQKAEQQLLPFYLWETMAHVLMLCQKKCIPAKSGKAILSELLSCLESADTLSLNPQLGDVHENIEQLLTQKLGAEVAGWIHTGRSRNDQVTTDQKLIIKNLFFKLGKELGQLGKVLGEHAEKTAGVLMPGFTHLRAGMPSTIGFWWQSYLVQLVECEQLLHSVYAVIDQSPLGAGASYGVNWPIDPSLTSKWLGFKKPFSNALAAINSRGIHELYLVGQLSVLLTVLSRLMEDISIFSSPQFGYLTLSEDYTSGSSIMPQKMNPDIAEKIRGKAAILIGQWVALSTVAKGTPSGYNRDSAETKPISIGALEEAVSVISIATEFLSHISANEQILKKAIFATLATKLADALAQTYHVPFRHAHQIVGSSLAHVGHDIQKLTVEVLSTQIKKITGENLNVSADWLKNVLLIDEALSLVTYAGSPAPEKVTEESRRLKQKHDHFVQWLDNEAVHFVSCKNTLIKETKKYIHSKSP